MPEKASLVLHNANVITMDPRLPRAEAVAVRGNLIAAVGDDEQIMELVGDRTTVVDNAGGTLIPGFNDAHCHLLGLIDSLIAVECGPDQVHHIGEVQEAIRQRAAILPPGSWIRASDYDEFHLVERRHPTRWDLDAAAGDHPVRLQHRSRHVCVLNSLALALAGIDRETQDPLGGVIERDESTGEPNGILHEMNALIGRRVVPKLTAQELELGFRLATQSFHRQGVTSVQDATVRNGIEEWNLFARWLEEGTLNLRLDMMAGSAELSALAERGYGPGRRTGNLRLGPVKIVLEDTAGYLWPPQDELDETVFRAHNAGFAVAIHASTEAAVEGAATAIERALCRSPRSDHRHRLEHCTACSPQVLRRLQRLRVVVVTQPSFLHFSGDRYGVENSIRQFDNLFRIRSFLDSGLLVAGSTDCPVVPNNPFIGLSAAMSRRSASGHVQVLPEEAISAGEALWLFTMGGAYASSAETMKGSITQGKLADLTLLDANPTRLSPAAVAEIQARLTVLDGRIVWIQEGLDLVRSPGGVDTIT